MLPSFKNNKQNKNKTKRFSHVTGSHDNMIIKNIVMGSEIAPKSMYFKFLNDSQFIGCLFHFEQIIWRKIQFLGLHIIYLNDEKCKKFKRYMLSLVFVPVEQVHLALNFIITTFDYKDGDSINEFIKYL